VKAVILAGGLGTRLSEETALRPKPMIEIGGRPILWHIMKIYASHGVTDFIICLGYRGYVVKEYFANYVLHLANVTVDLGNRSIEYLKSEAEPWRVTLIDTGDETMTGGRLKRVRPYLNDTFFMTYGDGVGDVDITALHAFHRAHGKIATVTAVQAPGRFGMFDLDGDDVSLIVEKPRVDGSWINGGFFIMEPKALDLVEGDATLWERAPMEQLATSGQLGAYRHHGYWQPMDTLREMKLLNHLWESGQAPWKTW